MFLDFVIVLIKAGVVLFALLNLAALLTWAERKQSAFPAVRRKDPVNLYCRLALVQCSFCVG